MQQYFYQYHFQISWSVNRIVMFRKFFQLSWFPVKHFINSLASPFWIRKRSRMNGFRGCWNRKVIFAFNLGICDWFQSEIFRSIVSIEGRTKRILEHHGDLAATLDLSVPSLFRRARRSTKLYRIISER